MSQHFWATTTTVALVSMVTLTGCEPDNELTPPGDELKFGESALVTRSDGAGTMSLKVVEVTQGDPADLEAIGYDAAEGRTPYYLKVEVTPKSGDRPIELNEYLGVWAEDASLTHLSVFEDFAACQEAPISVDELDEPQDACLVYLADEGASPPDSVYFDNHDDYSAFDGNAVSWK